MLTNLRRTIGFTGTIGSGKSARVKHLQKWVPSHYARFQPVVHVISADKLGHSLYAPGTECYHEIVQAFGDCILQPLPPSSSSSVAHDPSCPPVCRKALGHRVFSDPAELQKLNRICRPRIEDAIVAAHTSLLSQMQSTSNPGFVLIEAAVLTALPRTIHLCEDVWLLHCSPSEAVQRIIHRDGLTEAAALQRVQSQATADVMKQQLSQMMNASQGLWLEDTGGVPLEKGLQLIAAAFDRYWSALPRKD